MQPTPNALIERPSDLTVDWLAAAVGAAVAEFAVERIGTGQMSECYRVSLGYAAGSGGPASVVLKVAASDPTSRQTGLALGLYEREVMFYTDIAPRLAGPLAHCYHHAFDPATGVFDLLLDDAAPAEPGDEIRGATVDQAMLAVTELGRAHGALLGDQTLAEASWLNRPAPVDQALITGLYAGFVDRYGGLLTPLQREICERLVASFDEYLNAESDANRPMGLVHGDYRLDNLLFGRPGSQRRLTIVDWQTVTWGDALTDLAYFLGCALPTEDRRTHWHALVEAYHSALGPDGPLTLVDVREGVRRQSFTGLTMTIIASMVVERTERGDEMFLAMLERNCSHILDTDALAVLPSASAPEPLRPLESDEASHPPGEEPLWNESWYFDFADPGQGIGGWVRLGLYPNEGRAWVNALLCGPDLPTIALNDFQVALPDDPAAVRADSFILSQRAVEPLRSYRVTISGQAQSYDDPSALLRGESGAPIAVSMDLVWSTVADPYRYRMATRYEIPCTVSGRVEVDGRKTHTFDAVAGQRDHSWGVRDWWAMDWVWSALHLDDGTHVHAVDIRIPGAPHIGIGYLQCPDRPLVELHDVEAREAFSPNDLPLGTDFTLRPGGLVLNTEVLGHAPVRLVADDGRVAHFPRGWVSVRTADGRTGVGWVEWNRNLSS